MVETTKLMRVKKLPGYTAHAQFLATTDGYGEDGAIQMGWAKVKDHDLCQQELCGCLKAVYHLNKRPLVILESYGREKIVFWVEPSKVIALEKVPA